MRKIIVFDLDDTLYKEIDFLKSAFREIVDYALRCSGNLDLSAVDLYEGMLSAYFSKQDAFDYLIASVGADLEKTTLLSLYRNHFPQISLSEGALELLTEIKSNGFEIGIITDGRSVQQRNKIKALGLDKIVPEENIVISEEFGSEKPNINNYRYFMEKYPNISDFVYVGDNIKKDFVSANFLGWTTICLSDNGMNIHKQKFDVDNLFLSDYTVNLLSEINLNMLGA